MSPLRAMLYSKYSRRLHEYSSACDALVEDQRAQVNSVDDALVQGRRGALMKNYDEALLQAQCGTLVKK